ncbi:MAG: hypothetical protein QME81_12650 [bacterium]|nr:hypothetical protein [bacterium]
MLIDDLVRRTQVDAKAAAPQFDLFADFNGIPKGVDKTEFKKETSQSRLRDN